jgi:predicted acetyltransferase
MYKYLELNDDQYKLTQVLYKLSFNVKQDIDTIRIKYDTSAFGLKNVGYFAVSENDEPAAFYGVFPMRLKYGNKEYLVAQSGDTMTAPNHRGKGLFIELAKMTYELAKNQNVAFVFGFPNENSLPGFQRKLDWQFFGNMQRFRFRHSVVPLCEMASKSTALHQIYRNYCHGMLRRYKLEITDQNIQPFKHSEDKGQIARDKDYYQYKLRNSDNHLIRMKEFNLLIKPKDHLIIGDVGYFKPDRLDEFMKTVDKLSKMLGCRDVIFTVSKNYWLYNYLIKVGEAQESLPIGFLPLDCDLPLNEISFTQSDYDTF